MYESPIEITLQQVQEDWDRQVEENIMVTVTQTYDIHVDKDELIKALSYDRQQYEKGRSDFKDEVISALRESIRGYGLFNGGFEREKNVVEEIIDYIWKMG